MGPAVLLPFERKSQDFYALKKSINTGQVWTANLGSSGMYDNHWTTGVDTSEQVQQPTRAEVSRRHRLKIVGTWRNQDNTLKAAERTGWLYVGKIHSLSKEDMMNYLQDSWIQGNIECDQLVTKGYNKAFQLWVSLRMSSDKTREGRFEGLPRPRTTGQPTPLPMLFMHGGGTWRLNAPPPWGCMRICLKVLGKPSYREPRCGRPPGSWSTSSAG